ncbi:hypothetical protein D3C71_1571740 [compost metagenome]
MKHRRRQAVAPDTAFALARRIGRGPGDEQAEVVAFGPRLVVAHGLKHDVVVSIEAVNELPAVQRDQTLGRDVQDVAVQGEMGLVAQPTPGQRVQRHGAAHGDIAHRRQTRRGRGLVRLSEKLLEHG